MLVKAPALMPLGKDESYCLEWFMCRSAKKLPGAFKADTWISLLCQASVTEGAVRHAVLALSSAHQEEVKGFGSMGDEGNNAVSLFTVKQYSKAISNLQSEVMNGTPTHLHVPLMSCILFAYMEFLRGHYTKGFLHLTHGLCLLEQSHRLSQSQDLAAMHLDGWITTHLTLLLTQARLLRQPLKIPDSMHLNATCSSGLDTFRSPHHARRILDHAMLRAFNLREHHSQCGTSSEDVSIIRLVKHRQILEIELEIWLQTHEQTVRDLPAWMTGLDRFAYTLMRVYWCVAIILARTCLATSEMVYDHEEKMFLEIVEHCIGIAHLRHSILHAYHDPEPLSPSSTSDSG
jgi:hypothetical protein